MMIRVPRAEAPLTFLGVPHSPRTPTPEPSLTILGRKDPNAEREPFLAFMADLPGDQLAPNGAKRLVLRSIPRVDQNATPAHRTNGGPVDRTQPSNLAIVSNDLPRSVMRPALSLHAWRLFLLLCVRATAVGQTERIRMKAKEVKQLFGLTSHSAYKQIEEAGDELMRTVMVKKGAGRTREKFQLVSFARYHDRIGDVELELHPEIEPFVLGLRSHFTRISLSGVLKIHSAPALKFFMLALSWDPRNKGNRAPYHYFDVAAFRDWMGLDPKKKEYQNDAVLAMVFKRAKAHLDRDAELTFEWEPHKVLVTDESTSTRRLRVVGWHVYPVANRPKPKRKRGSPKTAAAAEPPSDGECEVVLRARAAQAMWDEGTEQQQQQWMKYWPADKMPAAQQQGLYFGNNLAEAIAASGDDAALNARLEALGANPSGSDNSDDQTEPLPF